MAFLFKWHFSAIKIHDGNHNMPESVFKTLSIIETALALYMAHDCKVEGIWAFLLGLIGAPPNLPYY